MDNAAALPTACLSKDWGPPLSYRTLVSVTSNENTAIVRQNASMSLVLILSASSPD